MAIREAGVRSALLQLFGVGAMTFLFLAIIADFVVSLRQRWKRVVVRVAGSWLPRNWTAAAWMEPASGMKIRWFTCENQQRSICHRFASRVFFACPRCIRLHLSTCSKPLTINLRVLVIRLFGCWARGDSNPSLSASSL
jgi:hypothetical protein